MVTFCANIHGPLDGEWIYYNFAAGSFHTKKRSTLDFIGPKMNFIK